MSGRSKEYFLRVFRGLPTNILQTAATKAMRGVDFRGCSKQLMAENYVMKFDRLMPAPSRISWQVMVLFQEGRISKKQTPVVQKWLINAGHFGPRSVRGYLYTCPACGYQHKLNDRYGCPNCHGEGLD